MRSIGPRVVALVAMLARALWTEETRADVVVRGETTVVDAGKLDNLVRLELGDGTDIDHVVVELAKDKATIVLERHDGRRRESVIALPARGSGDIERTIALLIGEASREQEAPPLASPPAKPVPPAADEGSPPIATDTATETQRYVAVFLGGDTSVVTSGGAFFIGPMFGADYTRDRLTVGLRGRWVSAWADDPLGTINARLLGARPNVAYRVLGHDELSIRIGTGIEAAWLSGNGKGERAQSVSEFAIVPSGFVEVRGALAEWLRMTLGVEGGWLGPGLDLRAADRSVLTASGAVVGVRLDLAFVFGAQKKGSGDDEPSSGGSRHVGRVRGRF